MSQQLTATRSKTLSASAIIRSSRSRLLFTCWALIVVLLSTLCSIIPPVDGKCPSREGSFCLQVDGFDTIVFDGSKFTDLKLVFRQISFLFEDSGEAKELDQLLLLNNGNLRTLDRNAFGDFRFRRIVIQNCTQLSKVNVDAFNGTKQFIKSIKFDGVAFNDDRQEDFFEALNSLENLEELELRNHRIMKIRAYSFRQEHLSKLVLEGPLEALENNGFYYLDGIRILHLSKSIKFIHKHAFDLKAKNNKTVDIYLDGKIGQIEKGAFRYTERPLTINLFLNKLSNFDAAIFRPVLMEKISHEIIFHGNPKDMRDPCQLLWLFHNKFNGVFTFKDEPQIKEDYFDNWSCAYHTSPVDDNNELPEIDNVNRAGIDATHNNSASHLTRVPERLAAYFLGNVFFMLIIQRVGAPF